MTLASLIEQYVRFRQRLGENCTTNGQILRAFSHFLGSHVDANQVGATQVRAFLDGTGPLTNAWYVRHTALKVFYRWAQSRGYVATMPLPTILPRRPSPFAPYVYSHDELQALLNATTTYQHGHVHSSVEPATIRTLILLLFGTGLRAREALVLRRRDVDLAQSLLAIEQTKFHKSRLVPFGPQVGSVLRRYAARTQAAPLHDDPMCPFFTTCTGRGIDQRTMERIFRCLCDLAGIRRAGGSRAQPRLHDLRHTFAVHRLVAWYRAGRDVQKLLPKLSVYLGHSHLASTQVYLSMTPELLSQASNRFAHYAL